MRNAWTIARRELQYYFASPIGYIVLAMFAVIFGYHFVTFLLTFAQYSGQMGLQPGVPPLNVDQHIIQPTLGYFNVVLLFVGPLITMRLFAEEQRQGTIELLLTSPLRDYEIIVGKWLGAMLLFGCMLLISLINFGVLVFYATPDWSATAVAFLGMTLLGGSLVALGSFISTTTKNQIVAGALTFGVFLMLFIISGATQYSTSAFGQLAGYLSLPSHFDQFAKGVIELKDVVYYVTAIALGLFLSKRSLESVRWKA